MTDFSFSHLLDKFDFPGQRLTQASRNRGESGQGASIAVDPPRADITNRFYNGYHKLRPRSHLIFCGSCIWVSNRSDPSRVPGTGK